ncbi:MAG: DUF4349 domain-containing protein [Treponema sp.]|nr:DUF4349 domain-containing protein [Treponema sp.]
MKKIHRSQCAFVLAAAALALAGLSLASCGAKKEAAYGASSASFASMDMADEEMDFDDAEYVMANKEAKAMAPEAPVPEPAPQQAASSSTVSAYERKLIKTGNVRLEVQSLAEVKAGVESWVKKYGGYIASSDESNSNATFTVKIPSERFEEAMGETNSFGKVTSKNMGSKDVTDRYYDLKSRLESKRIMQDRLENYLKSAKDIKDMLEIESKLNDVTADLESMQGQLNRLAAQISFSEITVFARLKANHTDEGFTMPDIGGKFNDLWGNIVYFVVGLFFVIIYVVLFGIPIVLILALLYWLCFGKIGLVRRLFAKLKK